MGEGLGFKDRKILLPNFYPHSTFQKMPLPNLANYFILYSVNQSLQASVFPIVTGIER